MNSGKCDSKKTEIIQKQNTENDDARMVLISLRHKDERMEKEVQQETPGRTGLSSSHKLHKEKEYNGWTGHE